MQTVSLHWFAAQQQTSAFKQLKIGLFHIKFAAKINELSLLF